MIITYKTIKGSAKSAHQSVEIDDEAAGEVWREQVSVLVSKLTEPRRMATKWRWFASAPDGTKLGRGTRAAMLLGPGFEGKDKALTALIAHRDVAASVHAVAADEPADSCADVQRQR